MPGQTMYAAVFGGLRAGRYSLLTHGAIRQRDVVISAAAVTTLDWRTPAAGLTFTGAGPRLAGPGAQALGVQSDSGCGHNASR